MKLLYQTHSPFARKALVFAHEAGLADRIEVVHHETSPTARNDEVFALNPLGKVPVLITDAGEAIFDSGVICQYLDGLRAGPPLIPTDPAERIAALRLQAVADGLSEAGILVRWETIRRPPALRYPPLAEGHLAKVAAGCAFLEARFTPRETPGLAEVAAATALSWLEFRDIHDFRATCPRLTAWYDAFAQRPSMRATALEGETVDVPPSRGP
ncbi:glutathione S-transferase family protein [Caulobacter sp. 1776]|uniref:glutathione S-transferase family protein n=1 Tax=Caulobacter sp. 1776 TaxID=3156420 RepID=UPI003398594F